jgi:hypothetical protein
VVIDRPHSGHRPEGLPPDAATMTLAAWMSRCFHGRPPSIQSLISLTTRLRARLLLPLLLTVNGCGSPAEPNAVMPFDPAGFWEATVQGTLRDSQFTGPLVVRLEVLGEPFQAPGSPFLSVELRGSWEWGGVSGPVEGFWDTPERPDQASSECAGGILANCAMRLSLEPPSLDYCGEPSVYGHLPIIVHGWFEDANRVVAPHVRGQYWQGYYTDPWPCTQPVLVGLDTSVELTPR